MASLLSLIALVTIWFSAEVRTHYVRQFDTGLAPLDETLVALALRDSTPDRYQTEEYFSKWVRYRRTRGKHKMMK